MSNTLDTETLGLRVAVISYIKLLNTDSPAPNTSHNVLGSLWRVFGREAVDEELDRQFELADRIREATKEVVAVRDACDDDYYEDVITLRCNHRLVVRHGFAQVGDLCQCPSCLINQ